MWLRSSLRAGFLLTALLVAGASEADTQNLTNHQAPVFTRLDLQHNQVSLRDYRGKVVLLNFWATWCAPCRIEIPRFTAWEKQYGSQGFAVLGISIDDAVAPVREFDHAQHVNYPIIMGDAKLAEQYGGVLGVPITFLIDRKGIIRARYEGETDLRIIEAEVRRLLSAPARQVLHPGQ
jgi:peroxiredoxin